MYSCTPIIPRLIVVRQVLSFACSLSRARADGGVAARRGYRPARRLRVNAERSEPKDAFTRRGAGSSLLSAAQALKDAVKGLSDAELGAILGVTTDAARKMRSGRIKSLKLEAALRLPRELKISPWYLAAESEPAVRLLPAVATKVSDRRRRPAPDRASARAQLETAESAPLLHDEVVELRTRVPRLERAIEELRSHAEASSGP